MQRWIRQMGACFLAMTVIGCALINPSTPTTETVSSPVTAAGDVETRAAESKPTAPPPIVLMPKVRVTVQRLNLRKDPSIKSRILGTLRMGDILEMVSKKGEWIRVSNAAGLSGWAFAQHLEPINDTSSARAEDLKIAEASPLEPHGDSPSIFKPAADKRAAENDFAQGYFEVDGKKIPLRHAVAELREDHFNTCRKIIGIFLTDRPVQSDDWREQIQSLSSKGALQFLELSINQSKQIIGAVLETPLLKTGYASSAGGHTFEAITFGPAAIAGSAFTEAREFQGQTYGYRVNFKATLTEAGSDKKLKASRRPESSYEKSIFNTPIHKAIEKMLLDAGDDEILRTVTGIASSTLDDFATADIECEQKGKKDRFTVFIYKIKDRWIAYKEIPTHLDHYGVFWMLARQYCAEQWEHFKGIGFLDESWKKKDPEKRAIRFDCSEWVNNQWESHHLEIRYAYDKQRGWQITDVLDLETTPRTIRTSQSADTT